MRLSAALAFVIIVQARVVTGSGLKYRDTIILKESQVAKTWGNEIISPALKPESSKQFFKKDYPADKKPGVDVLHFKHPYPVVQDSQEFENDFVKDQNKDNGEFAAQQEYDRLRHKLASLKKKAADALEEKNKAKAELDEVNEEYLQDMSKKKAEIAQKEADVVEPLKSVKPVEPAKPLTPVKVEPVQPAPAAKETRSHKSESKAEDANEERRSQKSEPNSEDSSSSWWSWEWPWSWSWPSSKAPKDRKAPATPEEPAPVDYTDEAKGVERGLENLKECKRQLEEAQNELKELMDELEKAKLKQVEAQENTKQAIARQEEAEKRQDKAHERYNEEESEYAAASAAYKKQKAIVEKLKAQLDAAAAKLKKYRDAEDKDGGVYNTPENSAATSVVASQLVVLVLTLVVNM